MAAVSLRCYAKPWFCNENGEFTPVIGCAEAGRNMVAAAFSGNLVFIDYSVLGCAMHTKKRWKVDRNDTEMTQKIDAKRRKNVLSVGGDFPV